MTKFELSKENFGYLIQCLYNTSDAQSYHGTSAFDKFPDLTLEDKLGDMIECNDHKPCKVLTEMFKK